MSQQTSNSTSAFLFCAKSEKNSAFSFNEAWSLPLSCCPCLNTNRHIYMLANLHGCTHTQTCFLCLRVFCREDVAQFVPPRSAWLFSLCFLRGKVKTQKIGSSRDSRKWEWYSSNWCRAQGTVCSRCTVTNTFSGSSWTQDLWADTKLFCQQPENKLKYKLVCFIFGWSSRNPEPH